MDAIFYRRSHGSTATAWLAVPDSSSGDVTHTTHESHTGTATVDSTTAVKQCMCYCLASWIAPINAANSDVPDVGQPTVKGVTTEVETETEYVFWTANVNLKTYVCATGAVVSVVSTVLSLGRNRYTITRSRRLIVGVKVTKKWGILIPSLTFTWGPWSAPARVVGPPVSNAEALGTSSPPSVPECTSVGIACP